MFWKLQKNVCLALYDAPLYQINNTLVNLQFLRIKETRRIVVNMWNRKRDSLVLIFNGGWAVLETLDSYIDSLI